MLFFDTWILIRKRGNIPTSKPLSSPSLTQCARQTPPAALLMQFKHEANSQTVWSSAQKFCARWTWSNFAHAPASCALTPADVMAWPSDSVQLKFDQYVAQPPISCASCPTCWWAEHKKSYQVFSSVVLCLPATSVASEHVFFKVGDVITHNRFSIYWRHRKPTQVIFLWTVYDCCVAVRLGFWL